MSLGREFVVRAKKRMAQEERKIIILGVRTAYNSIMEEWPVYSGYSKANNRISITGRTIRRVEPARRPSTQGALLAKAESTRVTELAKLARISERFGGRDRVIVIGNAVTYAEDVGFSSGQGRSIYQRAAAEARAVMGAAAK